MTRVRTAIAPLLLVLALAGAAYASGDALIAAGFRPSCGCTGLTDTQPFRSGNLAYVGSDEFAQALSAVANGDSRYSPAEIPPVWKAAAASWNSNDAFGGSPTPAGGAEPCNAVLVYLASLELRSRPGHEGIAPAFPRVVREASAELRQRVAAKEQLAPAYERRAALIGAKLLDAERMGARECQPAELARARGELESARRFALSARSDLSEADAALARVDVSADALLAIRRYAARHGIYCIGE